jgi:CubicO group peptidase (beta-lactamase class C family)
MKNFIFTFRCLILISFSSSAQFLEKSEIDSIFLEWDKSNAPGCALGIMKDGELIYNRGYGMANLEYDIPLDKNSVFRIGSTSKQFTAACIVLLAEEGKLNIDDRLSKFFNDFPEYSNHITIRHLLNHTSGIRDYGVIASLKGYGEFDFYEDSDIMEWLKNQQNLNFNPGSQYLYSNSGYWLLGQIVNQVANKNMAEFAKEKIFDLLEMTVTHFHNDHTDIVKNRASGYRPSADNKYKISMSIFDRIGAGGIFTSISDIIKWDNAFYSSDVFSPQFWSIMTEQGVLNNGNTISYAKGLIIDDYKGLKTISHGGAFYGFRADLIRFPEQKFSVVVLANRADANPTSKCYQVADILLKEYFITEIGVSNDSENTDQNDLSEFELGQLIGTYEIQPGIALKIGIKNDSLNVLQLWNQATYKIIRAEDNSFQIPEIEDVRFIFSDIKEGSASNLVILQNGKKIACRRMKKIDPTTIKYDEFVGKFYSQELDIVYEISENNNSLVVKIGDNKPIQITPYNNDSFLINFGLIRFQRKDNLISGFHIDAGRERNFEFKKQ